MTTTALEKPKRKKTIAVFEKDFFTINESPFIVKKIKRANEIFAKTGIPTLNTIKH